MARLNKQLREYVVARERPMKERVMDRMSKTESHERNIPIDNVPQKRLTFVGYWCKLKIIGIVTTGAYCKETL